MEPMGQVTLQVTLEILVILVTPVRLVILVTMVRLVLVKSRMGLTLPILEHISVDSQMILFMTLLLERTRQIRDW